MWKFAVSALLISAFLSLGQNVGADDNKPTKRLPADSPDVVLLERLQVLAYDLTSGTNRIQTRIGAIDLIGELGKDSEDAVSHLEVLLRGDNTTDDERRLYFQHVLLTAEKIGWPARRLLPEILVVSSRDIGLDPYVKQAVDAILKANPANKAPATAPPAPAASGPAPSGLSLADVNKQLIQTNTDLGNVAKSLSAVAASLDKLSKQLDAQLNPKPAEK